MNSFWSNRIAFYCLLLVAVFCLWGIIAAESKANSEETTMAGKHEITIYTNDIVHPQFGGVGFHVFHHFHPTTKAHLEQVIAKRWREMNPSFARLNDRWDWDKETLDKLATHLTRLKETGTEVYMTTWNPKKTEEGEQRVAYAKQVVDNLEYLIREKGADNIKYYCMTNELSLNKWGDLRGDLPKFKDYHQKIFQEIKDRKLDIQLLATDASPIGRWDTIEWAVENMDDITGVYGGHHYINKYKPEDKTFYSWFLSKVKWGAGIARRMNKNFIIGEFGCKQDGRIIAGIKRDVCIYWDTPQEPMVGIQLSEAVIAALNGGAYALGSWTFTDFPDSYSKSYINKWGTFKWSGNDYSTRAHYYAYGLLTRFFRGQATVFKVNSGDELLRVAALQHHDKKTYSIAIVSRRDDDVPVTIILDGEPLTADFRKYVYDPEDIPWHPFGDLQDHVGKVSMKNGSLTDMVHAGTLTIYTTAYDEEPPAAVKGLTVEKNAEGKLHLKWQANTEQDFCYYRIYRSVQADSVLDAGEQIGSTIATEFLAEKTESGEKYHYKVIAVDQSGNPSNAF